MFALAVVRLATRSREAELGRGALSWPMFLVSLLGLDLMATGVHVVTVWAGFELATIGCAGWIASRREIAEQKALPESPAVASDLEHAVLLSGMTASALMLLG